MAFISGTANNFTDLRSSIFAACTANGWSTDGEVLYKNDCCVTLTVEANALLARIGTGHSSGALVNPIPVTSCRPRLISPRSTEAITFPLLYSVHVVEDEVYVLVNWGGDKWAHVAFGQSPIRTGEGAGVGVWLSAGGYSGTGIYFYGNGCTTTESGSWGTCGLFNADRSSSGVTQYVYHNADGTPQWSASADSSSNQPSTTARTAGTQKYLAHYENPAANWNNQGGLYRVQPCVSRPENKVSIVADLKAARYCSLDTLEPGDIITLGPDRWRVYPFYKKNTANRRPAGNAGNHSGTYGFAVYYDGA